MKISDLISDLQDVLAEHGNIDVVSGLRMTGWGAPVCDLDITEAKKLGEKYKVLDLVCDNNIIYED